MLSLCFGMEENGTSPRTTPSTSREVMVPFRTSSWPALGALVQPDLVPEIAHLFSILMNTPQNTSVNQRLEQIFLLPPFGSSFLVRFFERNLGIISSKFTAISMTYCLIFSRFWEIHMSPIISGKNTIGSNELLSFFGRLMAILYLKNATIETWKNCSDPHKIYFESHLLELLMKETLQSVKLQDFFLWKQI